MKRRLKFFFFVALLALVFSELIESCESVFTDDQTVDGKMMFWSDFDGPPIDVYVANSYEGSISAFFNSTPACETQGCVTVTLSPGTYYFHAEEQKGPGSLNKSWDDSVTVRTNGCGSVALSK